MPAPFSDLASKAEAALISVSTGLVSGATLLTGTDDETKTSPQIIAIAQSAGEDEPLGSGNFRMSCRVTVVNQVGDVSLATHRSRVATVFDAYRDDEIADTLSDALADFHCIAMKHEGEEPENTETQFRQSILLELYCCGTDL